MTTPFDVISSGTKTIESRLYDKKRQQIQIGDTLIFANRENVRQIVSARVIDLLHYETFHNLFSHNDVNKFGGESVEWLQSQIREFYSTEQQHKYGVIGIEFELL